PHGGRLRIGISDSGSGFDVSRALQAQFGSDRFSGRGLHLVRQLSDRFDWQSDGRGLSVEFAWQAEA
ncbi:MAG TPA: fused response regulator/phosphatase, partial [Pseudomonas sp.]|nr:fused response regulator/phosphatase [Pseudomonas sp.]